MACLDGVKGSSKWGRWVFPAATLVWTGFVACGGEALDSDGAGGGDGDGDRPGGGDGDGDGDGFVGGDGDGDGDADGINRSCEQHSDCILTYAGCCGVCGVPSLEDMTAVHIDSRLSRPENCGEIGCPDCVGTGWNEDLYAACVEGTCEAMDLNQSADAECATSEDCVLTPRECCECGAPTGIDDVVALNASRAQAFRQYQCTAESPTEPLSCPECEWDRPSDLVAACVGGRCSIEESTGGDGDIGGVGGGPAAQLPPDNAQSSLETFLDDQTYRLEPWVGDSTIRGSENLVNVHGNELRVFFNQTAVASIEAGDNPTEVGAMIVKELYEMGELVGHAVEIKIGSGNAFSEWLYYCNAPAGSTKCTGSSETLPLYGTGLTECSFCHGGPIIAPLP